MTPLLFLTVAVAGGLGAGLRYVVDALVTARTRTVFPWGILVVNVTGSLALGILAGSAAAAPVAWVVGTGLLGGYTTFSAVCVTSVVLAQDGRRRAAALNTLGTLVATVAAAALGLLLGMFAGTAIHG